MSGSDGVSRGYRPGNFQSRRHKPCKSPTCLRCNPA